MTPTLIERCGRRERTTIGPFRVERLLGIGATSAVYEATHETDAQQVALKVLHDELRTSKDACARLARQVDVSRKVEHPGVLRVFDFARTEVDTFLVMDRLVGETAASRMTRSPHGVDPREAVRWTLDILAALEVVHSCGVLHRDIKPANLFLQQANDSPVLIDFGSAVVSEGGSITRTGQYLGTPAFMPPELAAGQIHDADARSDLWSVAATTFYFLTGQYVHPARSAAQQLLYAATQPARSLGTLRTDLDTQTILAIDRALRFDAKERFSSAADLRAALELNSLA